MALLTDNDRDQLKTEFEILKNPVKLVFFELAINCDYCPLTKQVLEELVDLSDKIHLQIYNYAIDKKDVARYKIARIPAIAVLRVADRTVNEVTETLEIDYGIRYYGVPAGYEFASLVGDIVDVSQGESSLSEQSKTALKQLQNPLHLQVFTTPT